MLEPVVERDIHFFDVGQRSPVVRIPRPGPARKVEIAGQPSPFTVEANHLGSWQELVERYRETGPPHIFHFSEHGMKYGRGLVFRGENGAPEEVPAKVVAQLLARRKEDRQTRLAFLNACKTTQSGRDSFQPFGGVADLLIQHQIPMVIGLQTLVENKEATELAKAFYRAIARGDSVDCAVQEAREELFFRVSSGVGWAFLNLIVAGQPAAANTLNCVSAQCP